MDADLQLSMFRKALPARIALQEILRQAGPTADKVCLDVGIDDPVFSLGLRKHGGTWHTVASSEEARAAALEMTGDNVCVCDGGKMPFEDKTFDIIVISNYLERIQDDAALVSECHRIIKPAGKLILNVPRSKQWSLLKPLELLLAVEPERRGWVRSGYTESQLFQLLKHGFDVHTVRSYSKLFVQLVDTIVQFKKARKEDGEDRDMRLLRLYSRAYPFYLLALQLDMLLFLTKGYYLIARAKRHAWRPREAPVLNDGRSISEAVLSKIAN